MIVLVKVWITALLLSGGATLFTTEYCYGSRLDRIVSRVTQALWTLAIVVGGVALIWSLPFFR